MDDEVGSPIWTTIGAVVVIVGLFFPLFTVHYSPPGGSAVVYGHRIRAFTDSISGWQFASAAQWTHLLFIVSTFATPVIALVFQSAGSEPGKAVAYGWHALCHIVIAFMWLLVLGIGLLENNIVMPYKGEKGILPEFAMNPFSSGYEQSLPNAPPTAHLSASFGLGWYVLLAGIACGIFGVWRLAIGVTILMILLLVITFYADNSLFHHILLWL